MQKKMLVLVSLSFLFTSIAQAELRASFPPIKNANPGVGAVVVYGDSLASGYGSNDPTVRPVGCLANGLKSAVQDFAVPGLTSESILAKTRQVVSAQPRLVFVSSGGNDSIRDYWKRNSYPKAKTMREMTQIFDQLTASGAIVVYLGLNPPYPNSERLPEITQLARQKGVIVTDGMAGIWQDSTLMSDQFHPNEKGYALMCQRILKAIAGHYP